MRGVLADLVELVFPADCPGCGSAGPATPLCLRCAAALGALTDAPSAPDPPPAGFPPCRSLGPYQGMLRELILSYKERGRLGLAAPLGAALAVGVAGVLAADRLPAGRQAARSDPGGAVDRPGGEPPAGPAGGGGPADRPCGGVPAVGLVRVPATGAAARARHGDHMLRLARSAARRLTRDGVAAVVLRPLVAVGRGADSTELTAAGRLARADDAFRYRPVPRLPPAVPVVLLDDLVTTGATLAGAARLLRRAGRPVAAAVTLAATQRRGAHSSR